MQTLPNTLQRGDAAEDRATELLVEHHYEIVERKFRCDAGELDIIARRGSLLVFVEVRSRSDDEHGSADWMVGTRKQRQVARVAGHYLYLRDPWYDEIRFDVIAITADDIDWIPDAFRLGSSRS
ncbi:MAG: YraN family protein [Kofleriaceae bacterium]